MALVKELTHLPVVVDPRTPAASAASCRPSAAAALAVGADGLLVEVHPDPDSARCDPAQQLPPEMFAAMMEQLRGLAGVMGLSV